jgi:hypothetical protein
MKFLILIILSFSLEMLAIPVLEANKIVRGVTVKPGEEKYYKVNVEHLIPKTYYKVIVNYLGPVSFE